MAIESVTQEDVQDALASLSNAPGIVTCAQMVVDEKLAGTSPGWEVSEALRAAVTMLSRAYCTLNDSDVIFQVKEYSA